MCKAALTFFDVCLACISLRMLRKGAIKLDGYGYGFIGGACALFDNTLYFCGNIELHPNYEAIKAFCYAHGVSLCSLTDGKLYDVGGIVFIN